MTPDQAAMAALADGGGSDGGTVSDIVDDQQAAMEALAGLDYYGNFNCFPGLKQRYMLDKVGADPYYPEYEQLFAEFNQAKGATDDVINQLPNYQLPAIVAFRKQEAAIVDRWNAANKADPADAAGALAAAKAMFALSQEIKSSTGGGIFGMVPWWAWMIVASVAVLAVIPVVTPLIVGLAGSRHAR